VGDLASLIGEAFRTRSAGTASVMGGQWVGLCPGWAVSRLGCVPAGLCPGWAVSGLSRTRLDRGGRAMSRCFVA
jgi:hypothetical protein